MSEKVLDTELTNKLLALSLDELIQLKARVNYLIQLGSKNDSNVVVDDTIYIKELLIKDLSKYVEVIPLNQLKGKDKVNLKIINIVNQIDSLYKEQNLQRENLSILCQIIALSAITKTNNAKIPLYFTTVIYNMTDVKLLLDESFPGYLKNNLLKLIIQQYKG